ncbi:hypothetical protein CPH95_00005 [Campylobacter sp. 1]|nr:hypothetical protein CPH95_00005 [Campylobacter sp. 1]
MANIKAMLLANTEEENLTVENFYQHQEEVHSPMVIFMNTETTEVIKHYRIAADTEEKLTLMYKLKYFDTPDLPEGKYEKFSGCYFVGVENKETQPTGMSWPSV